MLNLIVNFLSGILAAAAEDWKESLAAFKEFAADSEAPEAHYLVGCAGFQIGKYKLAARHLQKAVEIDGNFADAWFMLALVYDKSGDEVKKNQSLELALAAKEPGAQSLEFLKRKDLKMPEFALPFLRLRQTKTRLVGSLPMRVQKLLRKEIFKLINE